MMGRGRDFEVENESRISEVTAYFLERTTTHFRRAAIGSGCPVRLNHI
jgi:hypothetical protein